MYLSGTFMDLLLCCTGAGDALMRQTDSPCPRRASHLPTETNLNKWLLLRISRLEGKLRRDEAYACSSYTPLDESEAIKWHILHTHTHTPAPIHTVEMSMAAIQGWVLGYVITE